MNWPKIVPLCLVLVLMGSLLPLQVGAAQVGSHILSKVEPLVIEQVAAAGRADFFVWMAEKADLSLAAHLRTKQEKGRFVYDTLVATADRTQRQLCAVLDRQGVSYQAFYISNKIMVQGGDSSLLLSVAARPDVARITANHQFQLQEPYDRQPPGPHTEVVEPNLTFVKADQVWAMNITGQGTVLAGNDTGLDETHPAIARHYRGCLNPPTCTSWDHNYNWWDATGTYPTEPADGHGHGTHTTGIMVGDDGGTNQIGMAPGAQTVHCKNMTDGGSGDDNTFTTCFQWDLAPWDLNHQNPDPTKAPDAVNNSWGYWGGGNPIFEDEITALQTAGILVEVSAGGEGSGCGTLRSPADYAQVLTTGAVSQLDPFPGTLSPFSGRGPSPLYPDDYFPDIMAPGVDVRSSLPGNTYEAWSGTSVSGPHATGLVALVWSANPALRGQVDLTQQIIKDTAAPLTGQGGSNCGGDYIDGPNNDWGYGTIDALAAVEAAVAIGGAGHLNGTVVDAVTTQPIAGALVNAYHAQGFSWNDLTDAAGFYTMTVAAGTFTVTADAFGYYQGLATGVVVVTDGTTVQDLALDPLPAYVVSGTVTDASDGTPLTATVEVVGTPIAPANTNPTTGFYSLEVPSGTYTLHVTSAGYAPLDRAIVADHDQTQDFALYGFCDVFTDTVENGNPGWTPGGYPNTWAITAEASHSPSHSWTDSPGAYYTNNNNNYIASPVLNLSGYASVTLSFWHLYDTEAGWDYCYVEYSLNGGAWTEAVSYDGTISSWEYVELALPQLDNQANVRIRFHFTSDTSSTYDGWHVDDIALAGSGPGCLPPQPMPPAAGFASNSPVLDGEMVVFTNTTTGTLPLHYTWNLGDGTILTVTHPTHLYPAVGTYTVTLMVTNTAGSDSISHSVAVECGPVTDVGFTWAPFTPTVDTVVTLSGTASSPAPISYTWAFGDGTTGSGQYVTHTYAVTGTMTVTMQVTSDCGSWAALSQTMVVVCGPVTDVGFTWAPFTPTVDTVVTLSGTASSPAPISYTWAFGDGTTGSGQYVTHTYAMTGTMTVTMWATSDCGSWAALSQAVIIVPSPPLPPETYTIYLPVVLRVYEGG